MIYVIGLGFVGLTTAIGLAFKGKKVFAYDNDIKIIKNLKNNNIHFHEPFLKKNLKKVIKNKTLTLIDEIKLINNNNYYFICVGTPSKKNGSVNLSIIEKAVSKIIQKINSKYNSYIIIKSTVVPGTVENLSRKYKNLKNVFFVSNPEFLREGYAWKDFILPDKIVIGSKNKSINKKIKKIYNNFNSKFFLLKPDSAEFSKYLSNTALSSMISFSNEMLMIAERTGISDIKSVFASLHADKRWIGKPAKISQYIYPGIGFGGYCLPKDLDAFIQYSKKIKVKTPILNSIKKINNNIFKYQIQKIKNKIDFKSSIYLLGLSFKPFSDDLRQSKSLEFAKKLYKIGYKNLILCDPICKKQLRNHFLDNEILSYPKIQKKSYYILLTAWPEYIQFINKNKKLNVFDLRYTS